jgi:hypothetical protein
MNFYSNPTHSFPDFLTRRPKLELFWVGVCVWASVLFPLLTQAQMCTEPVPGLVSWWTADGNGNDIAGSNPGTLQNGLTFGSGEVDQAFALDGIDDYFVVPASPTMNVGTGSGFSIECWIWPAELTNQYAIAEWNDGSGNIGSHFYISIPLLGGLGSIYANIVDSGGGDHYFASNPNVLNTFGFQHIALTYDKASGIAKIYYNGAVVAAQTLGSFIPQTSYAFYLGARLSGPSGVGSYFAGLMDELGLYNRALSDLEILNIYDAGTGGKCKTNPPQYHGPTHEPAGEVRRANGL